MLYLWVFGDNIEDRIGHFGFLAFYLTCGLAAAFLHIFTNTASIVPTVGASGAIAGVLGAYLVLFPGARVLTLVPIFFFFQLIELPALVFLGFWFVMQFFSGAMSLAAGDQQMGELPGGPTSAALLPALAPFGSGGACDKDEFHH
jgi:membrane associated rhomboid family serine protease